MVRNVHAQSWICLVFKGLEDFWIPTQVEAIICMLIVSDLLVNVIQFDKLRLHQASTPPESVTNHRLKITYIYIRYWKCPRCCHTLQVLDTMITAPYKSLDQITICHSLI